MGPLKGLKILEFAGIGPGPFCGMLLADLGAEVIRLDKSSTHGNHNKADIHNRNKKSITADLKNPESIIEIKKLISQISTIEQLVKQTPLQSKNILSDFLLKISAKTNSRI